MPKLTQAEEARADYHTDYGLAKARAYVHGIDQDQESQIRLHLSETRLAALLSMAHQDGAGEMARGLYELAGMKLRSPMVTGEERKLLAQDLEAMDRGATVRQSVTLLRRLMQESALLEEILGAVTVAQKVPGEGSGLDCLRRTNGSTNGGKSNA